MRFLHASEAVFISFQDGKFNFFGGIAVLDDGRCAEQVILERMRQMRKKNTPPTAVSCAAVVVRSLLLTSGRPIDPERCAAAYDAR